MYTTDVPSQQATSDQTLIGIIAAVRAKSSLSQPARVDFLLTHGLDALLEDIFGHTLINPERDTALEHAAQDLSAWRDKGYKVTSILDPSYPRHLAGVHEAPAVLFSVGDLDSTDNGISVVGSRNASPGHMQAASEIATELVRRGLTVVSGLAAGVDAAAHAAALSAGGRTVAVMGTGLDHTYPAAHRGLRQSIESTGLVVSQFLPEQTGSKASFPMRNAVMSGYGRATIVVGATEKSGTRHQAKAAVGHSRGLILTPQVAANTSWGRAYVEAGVAQIAHNPEDAVDIASAIIATADAGAQLFA
ncbi:MAG: DNA-processing protein DprA [Corynebacterium sp.]|uniref:DNA-processing protein DprA n=1 Tax=Corynebacterium sp. TaxID=1720 RepID=UPI001858F7A2|nr:DNA-processing protein DprA [Corynebacterium sp.]NWO17045.1 DNA-processing protein DprA [Corynebacterium sp.]